MSRFDGSLALKLNFGAITTTLSARSARRDLRLAANRPYRAPDKYKALEHRRRQAQIHARRQLDLPDGN